MQYRLKQLNNVLHFEYDFEENLANDVINYTRLLNEGVESCGELVGFLLSRGDDAWVKDETAFLKEILDAIICNSDHISRLLK